MKLVEFGETEVTVDDLILQIRTHDNDIIRNPLIMIKTNKFLIYTINFLQRNGQTYRNAIFLAFAARIS